MPSSFVFLALFFPLFFLFFFFFECVCLLLRSAFINAAVRRDAVMYFILLTANGIDFLRVDESSCSIRVRDWTLGVDDCAD